MYFYGDCVYFLNSVYSWGGKGGPWSDGLLAGSFHFSDSFGALYNTNGSRFFWTIIYKCLSYCENDNICNVIDI